MEQTKKIDVIVPVFNVEQYLTECLDSLLHQTIPVHIVIVDDGSTDASTQIAKAYHERFPLDITYVWQANAGLSAARNKGLKHVRAQYVAFMDSDDWVSPDYYEHLLQKAERTAADVVCTDITYIYPSGRTYIKPSQNSARDVKESTLQQHEPGYPSYILSIFPMVQNKLWRTSLIQNKFHFLEGRQYEDLDFFYRIYPHIGSIAFITKGTFYYRQRTDSIVKTGDEKVLDIIPICKHILGYYRGHQLYDTYWAEIEYLVIRNCLVASAKRLAYSRDYRFIRTSLATLFAFVEETVPNWRQNPYIQRRTIRHIFIKSFSRHTIGLHAVFLRVFTRYL